MALNPELYRQAITLGFPSLPMQLWSKTSPKRLLELQVVVPRVKNYI
jgi:hypothetical protein